jgi:HEAT repeat protein
MGFLRSLFSGTAAERPSEETIARRLGTIASQEAKVAAAAQVWPMIRGAMRSSAAQGRLNVVVAGSAELSPDESRRLASGGLERFQEAARANARKEERALLDMIGHSPGEVARALLDIVSAEGSHERPVRQLAGQYLVGELGDDIAGDLVAALREGNEFRRFYAAHTLRLKEIKTSEVAAALTEALHDPDGDVRREAAAALGPIGDRAALPALQAVAAADPEARVKQAAEASARLLDPAAAGR